MIEKFAWRLEEEVLKTLPDSDCYRMPVLTEAVENEVDYGTEAFR